MKQEQKDKINIFVMENRIDYKIDKKEISFYINNFWFFSLIKEQGHYKFGGYNENILKSVSSLSSIFEIKMSNFLFITITKCNFLLTDEEIDYLIYIIDCKKHKKTSDD